MGRSCGLLTGRGRELVGTDGVELSWGLLHNPRLVKDS